MVENEVDFAISLQYLNILYLNRLADLNSETVSAFIGNENFVTELVDNQIIPPYYQSWTKVLLVQARSRQNNALLDRENALATLDSARREAKKTTSLITERAKNNFSSPKDINDALIIQEEIEKSYYTTVLLYYTALAEYFNLTGAPRRITEYLN